MNSEQGSSADKSDGNESFLVPLIDLLGTPERRSLNISNEAPVCIDLTEDDEPPDKKICLANNLAGSNRFPPADGPSTSRGSPWNQRLNGASTSVNNGASTSAQAGPSNSRHHQTRHEAVTHKHCSKCGAESRIYAHLDCSHSLCYGCLVETLRKNKTTVNYCPIPLCNQPMSDEAIKDTLFPGDYTSYLEHYRDILRNALWHRERAERSLNGTHRARPSVEVIEIAGASDPGLEVVQPVKAASPVAHKCREVMEIEDLIRSEVQDRNNDEFHHLKNLDIEPFARNGEPFDCLICYAAQEIGEGVTLKNCLHSFCMDCLSSTIEHADEPTVLCPFSSGTDQCEFPIQEREIRALVSAQIYEKHLALALKRAESNLDNVFHCKLPDCAGFVECHPDNIAFICPVCQTVNCIPCKAIHEDKICKQYQEDKDTESRTNKEMKADEEHLNNLIANNQVSAELSLIFLCQ